MMKTARMSEVLRVQVVVGGGGGVGGLRDYTMHFRAVNRMRRAMPTMYISCRIAFTWRTSPVSVTFEPVQHLPSPRPRQSA